MTVTINFIDGRLKEWGSGGRDTKAHKTIVEALQIKEMKASQITQQITERPLRTTTVRYLAKSYIEDQKIWNKNRDALIDNVIRHDKSKAETP